jgi:hypothetical protein
MFKLKQSGHNHHFIVTCSCNEIAAKINIVESGGKTP